MIYLVIAALILLTIICVAACMIDDPCRWRRDD